MEDWISLSFLILAIDATGTDFLHIVNLFVKNKKENIHDLILSGIRKALIYCTYFLIPIVEQFLHVGEDGHPHHCFLLLFSPVWVTGISTS